MFMFETGDGFIDLAVGTMGSPNTVELLQRQIGIESRVHWFSTLHDLPEAPTDQTRELNEVGMLKSWQHPDHDTEVWPPESVKK